MAFIAFAARVAESSTTTGTGAMALSAAVATYKRFNTINGITVGDTLPYYIVADDGSWEHAIGTYSAANTITRPSQVIAGSNGANPVAFAVGNKSVFFGDPGIAGATMAADALPMPSANDKVSIWNSLSNKLNSLTLTTLASWLSSAMQDLTNKTIKNPANGTTILPDASAANSYTVNWDMNMGQTALLTTTNQTSRIIANPTNLKIGGVYTLIITQGVANQVISSFGSVFSIIGDYTLATAVGSTTMFYFVYDGVKLIGGVMSKGTGTVSAPPPASTPAPTPAPSSATTFKVQAEAGTLAGTNSVMTTDWMGPFEGSYVGDFTTVGDSVTVTTPSMSAGTYSLTIRIVTFGAQKFSISINNGTPVQHDVTAQIFPFGDFVVTGKSLSAGTNTIKVFYNTGVNDSGNISVDYISGVQTATSGGGGTPPPPPPAPSPNPPLNYPLPAIEFGTRPDMTGGAATGVYPYGIRPSKTNAQMDADIRACYDLWKAARLKLAPTFTPTHGIFAGQQISDAYYVDSDSIYVTPPVYDETYTYIITPGVKALTVSEGMGYGMLIMVMMAGYEPYAKTYFDGMYKLWRGRPAYNMTYFDAAGYGANFGGGTGDPSVYLMDWKLKLDTSYAGGGEAAADGDMDMAMAMLMAHRQWGSTGAINYLDQAKLTIAALKKCAFSGPNAPANRRGLMYVGGTNNLSRTSDYMPTHFRAFQAATSDTFWYDARINSYNTLNEAINKLSPVAKLPPGFIRNPLAADYNNFTFTPLGEYFYESRYTGIMDGNAMRCPWRAGFEHLWYGPTNGTDYGALASNMTATIKATSSNDVNKLGYMYIPAATSWNDKTYTAGNSYDFASYYDPGVAAMTAVGGCCNSTHQAWVDAAWNRIAGPNGFNTTYFVGEPTLLSMLIISGNWWKAPGI